MASPQPDPALEGEQSRLEVSATILALVEAQGGNREQLAGQVIELARHAAEGFTGWYDSQRITVWAERLAKDVAPVLRTLARNTDAFQARVISEITGRRVRPVGAVDVSGLRQGISPAGAYGRAADVYRWQQAQLDSAARALTTTPDPLVPDLQDPIDAAVERAIAVADMDGQLAVQQQSRKALVDASKSGLVTGWRRVIHPELSKTGACGLCVAASDRLYGPHEPMPLHAHCNCVPMPVYDRKDPGSALNDADLKRLYDEAGSTGRADLKRTRYQVNEHGELGPLLSEHTGKVRGPRQVKRDTSPPRPPKTPEQKVADLQKVRDSLTPAAEKARALAAVDPKKWGGYLTKLEARMSDLDHQLAA